MKALKLGLLALFITTAGFAGNRKTIIIGPAMDGLIKSYLGIKDALASDDAKAASNQARLFTAAIKVLDASTMDDDKKAIWAKYSEKLRYNGEHIGEVQNLKHQREHFAKLSDDMYNVVKGMKTNDFTLYRQYCPMKKAYWLSMTTSIVNPYYGKAMQDCGQVRETLPKQ